MENIESFKGKSLKGIVANFNFLDTFVFVDENVRECGTTAFLFIEDLKSFKFRQLASELTRKIN